MSERRFTAVPVVLRVDKHSLLTYIDSTRNEPNIPESFQSGVDAQVGPGQLTLALAGLAFEEQVGPRLGEG